MRQRFTSYLRSIILSGALGTAACTALARPTVTIFPTNNNQFLVDQRFDIRVEVKPTTGQTVTNVTLAIDNVARAFDSNDTYQGYNGYNVRAYSFAKVGEHKITATVTETGGGAASTLTNQYNVVNPLGTRKPVRNIIICLGDGMGAAHRTAARIVRYGVTNGHPNGRLAMDEFPATGMVITHSLNSIVTDSAPGMSCYATGSKAANSQEGVYPAHMANVFAYPRVEYMSEYLHRKLGKSLGLVTTADIEDATPAANAVHTGNRNNGTGICDQYLDESGNTGLTVLMGGGRRWFLPSNQFGSSRAAGTDAVLPADLAHAWGVPVGVADPTRDLIADFMAKGFTYAASATDLKAVSANTTKLLGLFGYGNMNVALDKVAKRRNPTAPAIVDDYHAPDQPMLDEMAASALKVLNKNPKGFLLLVEGAHIDKQSHAMDADRAIGEVIEFDNAVRRCREFADATGNTLIIVTADHECSGFSIIGASIKTASELRNLPGEHDVLAPNAAPQRQTAVGTYDAAGFPQYVIAPDGYPVTTDIDYKLLIGFGANGDRYEDWLSKPTPIVDSLMTSSIQGTMRTKGYTDAPFGRLEQSAGGFFIRGQAVGAAQAVHTAADIPLSAYSSGVKAWPNFVGVQENTDVFFKIVSAAFGNY